MPKHLNSYAYVCLQTKCDHSALALQIKCSGIAKQMVKALFKITILLGLRPLSLQTHAHIK